MAGECMLCKMLCVVLLLISQLSVISSSPETNYYDTYPIQNKEILSIVLQDQDVHILQKRETAEKDVQTTQSANETVSNVTISTNQKPTYQSTESPAVIKSNSTLLLNRNLGVNGTGIRKNITKDDSLVHSVTVTKHITALNTTVTPINATTVNVTVAKNNQTGGDEDEIAISNFSDEILNKTLSENNATKTEYDTHEYYNSTFTVDPTVGEKYWVNMTNLPNVKVNELLSKSHRRAATVKLSFDFPFYGHIVRNVTIATGGFLYTGEYVHSWLAATQYIAPLMANFDTSLSNDSYIKYVDNGTAFTVQWEKVSLQDKPNGGDFTFQATLHDNGDIVFVYQHVPVYIDSIQDEHHPVKVGLSDAYIIDRTIFFVRRKTIYEYHRVHFNREDIKNWTVIFLSALPTCLINKDCNTCLTKPTSNFECTWCSSSNRCSNGMDRHRQDWLMKDCERKQLKSNTQCSLIPTETSGSTSNSDGASSHYDTDIESDPHQNRELIDDPKQASRMTNEVNIRQADKPDSVGVSGVISVLIIVGLIAGLSMWVLYAYRNPHSASGQMLIRYRPSQWSWRRGEARYTAATIHM